MGNKLGQPELEEYEHLANKKKELVLRLWVDIFNVKDDSVPETDLQWYKITEEVVPVNIASLHDDSRTIYSITAYNQNVQQICDLNIVQPGTKLRQPTETFIHTKDVLSNKFWGFNFTSADDCSQFRDTCLTLTSSPLQTGNQKLYGSMRAGSGSKTFNSVKGSARRSKTHDSLSPAKISLKLRTSKSTDGEFDGMLTMPKFRHQPTRMDSRLIFADSKDPAVSSPTHPSDKELPDITDQSGSTDTTEGDNSDILPPPTSMREEAEGAECDQIVSPRQEEAESSDLSPPPPRINNLYEKQSTLSSSHLQAILFSSDNLLRDVHNGEKTINTLTSLSEEESSGLEDEPTVTYIDHMTDHMTDQMTDHVTSTPNHSSDNTHILQEQDTLRQILTSIPSPHPSELFGREADGGDPRITGPIQDQNSNNVQLRHKQKRVNKYESYPDSGFGGTHSTEKTSSITSSRSVKSRRSRTSNRSRSSGKSKSSVSDSISDTSSIPDTGSHVTHVQPFTLISDDETVSTTGSIETVPPTADQCRDNFLRLSTRQGGSATRKTGWLEVKNWLDHVKRRVVLAKKRSWRRYWVTLRGHSLLLYSVNEQQTNISDDMMASHVISIQDCVVQSIPEHTKRQNIFSVSTAFAGAYLFQAPTQIEHDNWIQAIMSSCATYHCKQKASSINPIKQLHTDIAELQQLVDEDGKMKKMGELQLTVTKDVKSRDAISTQINQWAENLERLYMDQFRFKCYLATLQGQELPNPQILLSQVSRSTKHRLGKLGILNTTSFHCLICARTPNAYNTYLQSRAKRKGMLANSLPRIDAQYFLHPSTGSDAEHTSGLSDNPPEETADRGTSIKSTNEEAVSSKSSNQSSMSQHKLSNQSAVSLSQQRSKFAENLVRIRLPNDQSIVIELDSDMTVSDVLTQVCSKRQLLVSDSFIRYRTRYDEEYIVPELDQSLDKLDFVRIEVCNKCIFQLEFQPPASDDGIGVEVECELNDDGEAEDEVKVFISSIKEGSAAETLGLMVGDELLTVNSQMVNKMDISEIEDLLLYSSDLYITVRSSRTERPHVSGMSQDHADAYIDNMMCPPPPSQRRISDQLIDDLIVPAPSWIHGNGRVDENIEDGNLLSKSDIKYLLNGAERVTAFCRLASIKVDDDVCMAVDENRVTQTPLTEGQKLRKVILELINTERSYVKDLQILMDRYLEPLKDETFLSSDELVRLVGNIQEIVHFQIEFLKNMEETIDEPTFITYTQTCDFKNILISIADSFLFYSNHFKLYSSFCASHSRAQKVLSPGDNSDLHEFLTARNPKQQHSATLESYLIKPIQRILKYPLLLTELISQTDKTSEERRHLTEALRAMESVAGHINDMQKLYEEFGQVFDDLTAQARDLGVHIDRRKLELNVGDLQHYGEAEWLNCTDDIGKPRKGCEFVSNVFVFKHGVVFLCQQRIKGKLKKYKSGTARGSMMSVEPEVVFSRFIPVTDLQVRTLPTAHARQPVALWEILHLKSVHEKRPEKTYHMACSNVDERASFLKHMRQIIRESVKRMSVPTTSLTVDEPVRMRHSATIDPNVLFLPSTDRPISFDNRYSMNVDLTSRLELPDLDGHRSRTIADLADMGNEELTRMGSHSSINSAKLIYSSQDPVSYSSRNSLEAEEPMDIWEKRTDQLTEIMAPPPTLNDIFMPPSSFHLPGSFNNNATTEC